MIDPVWLCKFNKGKEFYFKNLLDLWCVDMYGIHSYFLNKLTIGLKDTD